MLGCWMMRLFFLMVAGWGAGGLACAVDLPEGGREMLPSPVVKVFAGPAAALGAVAETVPVTGRSFAAAQRLILPQGPAHAWDAGARSQLRGTLTEGEVGVLVFEARALPLGGGQPAEAAATGTAYLEEALPPQYPKAAQLTFQCGPEWQVFTLSFQAARSIPEGKGALAFHLGQQAQAFEFGPMRLLNYGTSVALRDLPRQAVTYRGREADAPWRKAALERIATLRMAPLTVQVMDAAGRPVPEAAVAVRQVRSAFGFGSAVAADWLTREGAEGDAYRKIVEECFSRVVFENDLKMSMWETSLKNEAGHSFRWANTLKSCDWLKQRGIGIRGHYLSWAPWEKWSEELKDRPDKIRERILTHLPRLTNAVGDRVIEWDAINHLAGWAGNIDEVTGPDFYTEIMKTARAATKLPLWVNEDQVFHPGRQQEDYYQRIRNLIAAGQKPDGIGNQAHFDDRFLPSPGEMLANSDRFAALVPTLQITEFDLLTHGDEALEADFLRDILTVCYSHPAYTGFLTWGFWEGAHWKPQTALWRKDWSEKPSAAVWRRLVNREWATQAGGRTTAAGDFTVAAHLGTYEVKVTARGKTQVLQTRLARGRPALTVRLPE